MNETFTKRWTRRIISISMMYFFLTLFVVFSPLFLLVTITADLIRGKGWSLVRVYLFGSWYVFLECMGIFGATVTWMAHFFISPDAYLQANYWVQEKWLDWLGNGSFRIFGNTLNIEGQEKGEGGPYLLFLRHASTMDTVLGGILMTAPYKMRFRYVFKKELLWDPCLDIMGNRIRNYFVDRSSKDSAQEIENVAALADDLGSHDGVLIYPEGTRFTPEKQKRILSKLKDVGNEKLLAFASSLKHILPPRLGGTLALLKRNVGADLVLCAHVGLEAAGSFTRLLDGELFNQTIHIKLWRFAFSEIPTEEDALIDWLFLQWQNMDQYIDSIKTKAAVTPT